MKFRNVRTSRDRFFYKPFPFVLFQFLQRSMEKCILDGDFEHRQNHHSNTKRDMTAQVCPFATMVVENNLQPVFQYHNIVPIGGRSSYILSRPSQLSVLKIKSDFQQIKVECVLPKPLAFLV